MKHGDLGSHSTRKGSITLVFSGCNVSPPISSICLRACWCMGNVKDRYLSFTFPGDYQYEIFVKKFHKVIRENKEEFEKLGVKPGDLGSHSTRKG